MSKLPDIGSDMNQDEKDYAEYIGVGVAHHKPPAKKMRLTTSSVSSLIVNSEVNQEPKSIDVFASSQPSNDGYETCRESIEDEETSGNLTENTQKLAENEIESECVDDSQEVESEGSMEIGEVFDETEIYEAEKRGIAAENKQNESNSSQEDEEVLKEMEIEMKTAEENSLQKSPSSQDIFDYESVKIPQIILEDSESTDVVRNNEEEEETMEVDEKEEDVNEADDVRMESHEEMNTEVVVVAEEDEDVEEQESETKSESLCRKKIERVSLEPNSGDEAEEIVLSEDDEKSEDVKAAPEDKKPTTTSPVAPKPKPAPRPRPDNKYLIFKPDFQSPNCNPKTNYRYCEVNEMQKQAEFYRSEIERVIINQDKYSKKTWRDLPNPRYEMYKNLLTGYARENRYKTDCLMLFSGLIHDMCGMTVYHPFPALFGYFSKYESYQGNDRYALDQFGRVVQIALSGYQLLPERIYCLMGQVESATLSHRQCAALIARMFFTSTAPNFLGILNSHSPVAVEKLRFLFAYFDRISANPPQGVVSFRRISRDEELLRTTKWRERKFQKLPEVTMIDDERIEQTTQCTQEEIRFLMCPEMIVGMLLSKTAMHNTESFSIIGAYVYSSYDGYGKSLKWKPLQPEDADQNDTSLRDKYGRLPVETIAIDAIQYNRWNALREQVDGENIIREILKAITGFTAQDGRPFETVPIRTGWWGCGAFGGCKQMKFMIQVVAAGYARRPLQFCTFGETKLSEQCRKLMEKLKAKDVRIGALFGILRRLDALPTLTDSTVFDYISTTISDPGWKQATPPVQHQVQ
ncbi:hypothetical protein GCK72_016039 [Caenorhabditis remanei]|uniref:poly(ADP-ribose) glycohydrolase n=1 Tax=Caenorhabditis remanei TaxID=31234 RepID=A0A6A5GZ47_CAERE|nr:hypothetical protein GCK72_016039 [Caenorhabditis remanei]KAF1759572.1 hypothetical protein GCK72_016039 [Caenorhabditis remanei]